MVKGRDIPQRKGNIELAEQHIELAGQLILEENGSADEPDKKLLEDAAFSLEKAGADLEESENN